MTVGPGITPGLLTPACVAWPDRESNRTACAGRSRARRRPWGRWHHRRWGVSPRP